MRMSGNMIHLRFSNLAESVLVELYTNLLANLWLFASSGTYSYPVDSVLGGLYENL